MCYICYNEWHNAQAEYDSFWEFYRDSHSTPLWRGRHSGIRMSGNGSRPIDGQRTLHSIPGYQLYWTKELRSLLRFRRHWTGKDTTQEVISSID